MEKLKQSRKNSDGLFDGAVKLIKDRADKLVLNLGRGQEANIPSNVETIWVKVLVAGFWGDGKTEEFCVVFNGIRYLVKNESTGVDQPLPS